MPLAATIVPHCEHLSSRFVQNKRVLIRMFLKKTNRHNKHTRPRNWNIMSLF